MINISGGNLFTEGSDMNNIHGKRALSIIMVAVFAVLLMMSTELFHPLYPLESESAAAPMSGSTGGTVRAETRPAGTDQTAETSPPPSRADHSVKTASASTTSREEASSAGMSTFPGDSLQESHLRTRRLQRGIRVLHREQTAPLSPDPPLPLSIPQNQPRQKQRKRKRRALEQHGQESAQQNLPRHSLK